MSLGFKYPIIYPEIQRLRRVLKYILMKLEPTFNGTSAYTFGVSNSYVTDFTTAFDKNSNYHLITFHLCLNIESSNSVSAIEFEKLDISFAARPTKISRILFSVYPASRNR